ncbi:MAG TPA: DPP IV N-terminal domain-containing protein [Cryomorphaceae bacterium]|nr:DPP IV N-terminal domain-containing protein [Cryomorphaceae bacterium]
MRRLLWLVVAPLFVLLGTGESTGQTKDINLGEIWKSGTFSPKYIRGLRSMSDGIHYTRMVSTPEGRSIVKYAYETGSAVDTLFTSGRVSTPDGRSILVDDYSFDRTESRLLLSTSRESIYRYSSKSNYYVYDMESAKLLPITDFGLGKQQLAAFSPTTAHVAFVRDNDLYISDITEGTETRVTTDGEWGKIINGAVDWVYEEEFAFDRGFHWSPDGKRIAYYRFDESEVKEFDMTMYTGLYPGEYRFKYPKAGERNSTVRIFVYDLADRSKKEVDLDADPEQYVPRIKWTADPAVLAVMRMNRHQSKLEFLLADASKGKAQVIPTTVMYTETSDTYIEINDNLQFLKDGKHFVWNSEKSGFNHLYLFDMKGREVGPITAGRWDIVEVYGVDEEEGKAYFSAAVDGPATRGVYVQDFSALMKSGDKNPKQPVNLAPALPSNSAVFSNTFRYFINTGSADGVPPFIALYDSEGKKIRDLETNEALRDRLKEYGLGEKVFSNFVTPEGDTLNYWMIKPRDFDSAKSYPVMFMIYGGPGSNTVVNSWGGANYMWHQMLAQQGFIIVSVDPRGTGLRGRDFKHSTYLQLGKFETEDFIYAAEYFGSLDYVDPDRIGMMGWSYGGYMSSLCLTKGAEQFELGIAVAPVTNWRYYDTIYTERFMRTPQENASGYDDNSPIHFVEKLEGAYLLVHGSADDNVHLQNTMEMITALVEADKQFDLFIYPDKNHGIYGGNTRYHLYTKMTDFIKANL